MTTERDIKITDKPRFQTFNVHCTDQTLVTILEIMVELSRIDDKFPPYNSAHEGYAIILEEMDELKDHVWVKQEKRDYIGMRGEALQVAATALRFARDVT